MGQASPSEATRGRIYGAIAVAFFLLAVSLAGVKAYRLHQPFDLVVSDARFYYAYLPAVIIDGNLDFTSQITHHWGPDFDPQLLEDRTPTGLVRNKYPIGLALTLSPAFLFGHVVALTTGGLIPADGYSWPYQVACLALIELMVWRTFMRADWLLTQRIGVSSSAVFAALITIALGTPYAYYACREPFMVHAVSAFWCTEFVAVAASTLRGPLWFWPRLAVCGAMAVVCRPTNIHILPVAIFGIWQLVRGTPLRQTLAYVPLALVALIPIGLQVTAWRLLSKQWLYYSYGDESFDWTRPALWQTLFSSRHGLFFWSPILLLAVAGLLRVRDRLIWSWMFGAVLLWYANSAWHCWWFGDAFGGRAFLELTALFGIGLALALDRWCQQIWQLALLAGAAVAFNLGLMALYINHSIPRAGYLLP